MRIIGIDPGTGSFDFFGMDGEKVILDVTVPVPEVAQNPRVLLDTIRSVFPLDMIVGPSGYGLPPTPIGDITERELTLMVPDDKSIPLYDGIRMIIRLMQSEGFPVYFTPGVIHLATVPAYRKVNKMDMGTADKVCCAVLAMRDQAEYLGIDYAQTSFIMSGGDIGGTRFYHCGQYGCRVGGASRGFSRGSALQWRCQRRQWQGRFNPGGAGFGAAEILSGVAYALGKRHQRGGSDDGGCGETAGDTAFGQALQNSPDCRSADG